jgi:hypothetical protein
MPKIAPRDQLAAQASGATGTEEQKKKKLSNETETVRLLSFGGSVLTHSGKAGFFCNDASQTKASHFPANRFYKRHLDKKLHLVSRLRRIDMR